MSYNIIKKRDEYIIYKETSVLGVISNAHVVEVFQEEEKEEAINKYNNLSDGGE